MRSNIFNLNWKEFNHKDKESWRQLGGAMQYYCALPDAFVPPEFKGIQAFEEEHKKVRAEQMQAFTIPSDFPVDESAIQVVRKYLQTPVYDNGYEQIFEVMNFTGTGESGFDIMDVQSGFAFNEILIGEKAKVYEIQGAKVRCYFNFYAGALGWHRSLFEDQQFVTIEINARIFRNIAYQTRAAVFYALLDAVADAKGCCAAVPEQCTDCNADADALARSLNVAATTILRQVQNRGYSITPGGTSFVVLSTPETMGRVRRALNITSQHYAGSERIVSYNFNHITSMMPANHNRIFVILPKEKLIAGYRMDLTLFSDFDILSYTDTVAGWMRYGGCVGDTDQIQCIELTPLSGSCPP